MFNKLFCLKYVRCDTGETKGHPGGTFKLMSVAKFSFKHVMEHAIKIPCKCHNFFYKFAMLVSLRVPSGCLVGLSPGASAIVVEAGGSRLPGGSSIFFLYFPTELQVCPSGQCWKSCNNHVWFFFHGEKKNVCGKSRQTSNALAGKRGGGGGGGGGGGEDHRNSSASKRKKKKPIWKKKSLVSEFLLLFFKWTFGGSSNPTRHVDCHVSFKAAPKVANQKKNRRRPKEEEEQQLCIL